MTEKVKRNPYSVVLLDEIEKAHPDLFNILLQVFEDGHLTDGLGNPVNFKNTIIIMTSNIGARFIQKKASLGFQSADSGDHRQSVNDMVLGEVRQTFNPEFINRIDEIIVFEALSDDDLRNDHGAARQAAQREPGRSQAQLELTPDVIDWIIERPARTARTEPGRSAGRSSATSRIRSPRSSSAERSREATCRCTSTAGYRLPVHRKRTGKRPPARLKRLKSSKLVVWFGPGLASGPRRAPAPLLCVFLL